MKDSSTSRVPAWLLLALLALVVLGLGGSSRPDAIQNVALRPLVALFLVPAIYYLRIEAVREARMLVGLLALLLLWMALQLVPLPPSVWQALPGRASVAELDGLTGLDGAWRPISLAPDRGWNAWVSLVVPMTALLLAIALRAKTTLLLAMVAGMGVVNALMGLIQVTGLGNEAFYFYRHTTIGMPAGLFANENHAAALSAIALLAIARLHSGPHDMPLPMWFRALLAPSFIVVVLTVLVGGSRAGIALTGLAILLALVIVWVGSNQRRAASGRARRQPWIARHPRLLLAGFALGMLGLVFLFLGLERAMGLEGLLEANAFEDLRWELSPILLRMAAEHWLFGIGFGGFEEVYHVYEPDALLMPQYVNQAHNDWAQLVIEGGLPGVALLLALLGWMGRVLWRIRTSGRLAFSELAFWCGTILIMAVSSVVDYPLRTPLFQLAAVWLLVAFTTESRRSGEADVRPADRGAG
ncbi:O-antigen ligase family protein [Altererythrobacter sp. H2]|uniref:O-antigen ligase family protein n=1 Tax=Altererythrobacter sp. H2 TaxID=3108391 RepID=UPI002B4BD485|nr:O-antigen ligase family protein [Altererythrobacter sp. H2]WRK95985.1 O-antigen ligase family protein [Altererythrobacter sp. H2]